MNCKKGDLAVIVGAPSFTRKWDRRYLGYVVRCVELLPDKTWWTDPELPAPERGSVITWYDAELRPIRDPGDDAKDETLIWFPVHQKKEVPA